jgi:DNA-binding IclR family transcriptional regulator
MASDKNNSPLYRVQVLERALAIVDVLAHQRREASLAEIAALVNVHKSTVHRLTLTLERHGYVERNPQTGQYRLGLRLFDLGTLAVARFNIRDRARPHLEKLMYNAGETVHLCVLDGGEVLYLDKVEPNRSVRLSSTVGHRTPAHCTAVGKAMLAYLPETDVDAVLQRHGMKRFTVKTLCTPAELKAELKSIRDRGHSVDDEEHEEGVRCIAAVVRDYSGAPAAAISVSAPSFRLPVEKISALALLVRETSEALSQEWGYRGEAPGQAKVALP